MHPNNWANIAIFRTTLFSVVSVVVIISGVVVVDVEVDVVVVCTEMKSTSYCSVTSQLYLYLTIIVLTNDVFLQIYRKCSEFL